MGAVVAPPDEARAGLRAWYPDALVESVPLVRGSLIGWLFGVFGQAAVTVDATVHLTPLAPSLDSPEGIALLGHEYVHVLQQRELGWWRFLARYVRSWRPAHIREGWLHPMETAAYHRQRDILYAARRRAGLT